MFYVIQEIFLIESSMITLGSIDWGYCHEIFSGGYLLGGTVMGYSLRVLTGRYCHEIFSGGIDWEVLP